MKIKVSEAKDHALDWAVALIEYPEWKEQGYLEVFPHDLHFDDGTSFSPSTDWAQGGPIIEREKLTVAPNDQKSYIGQEAWTAYRIETLFTDQGDREYQTGPTPLIAAMRCYVAFKLGDEVEIPEESK
jgi:hypothetical protein